MTSCVDFFTGLCWVRSNLLRSAVRVWRTQRVQDFTLMKPWPGFGLEETIQTSRFHHYSLNP